MNPVERLARRIDAAQQRFGPAALIFGVMKKFGDDNAGTLVSSIAFSAFLCLFPLLLLLVTILELVLAHDPGFRRHVLSSALSQFPVIGQQLGHNVRGLHRSSVIGLVVGVVGLLWGSTGLAQAGLFSMSQVWNLPGPDRPNYITRLGRSVLFLVILGLGLVASTGLAAFGTFGRHNVGLGILSELVAILINGIVYLAVFRVLTPKAVSTRKLVPGAGFGGVAWTILVALGGYLIGHDLRHDSVTYGVFGVVLGLAAWIYLGSELTIYAAELNSVVARHLWPRGMVQPPLTRADQQSMALQATQNQRRPEQEVSVGFSEPAMSQSEWLAARSKKADIDAQVGADS